MLINATQEEELRMAMVDGQLLYDLNIELPSGERKKANIYKGQITRIEPSLEAAFVNYGADRHGFLPLKEISSEYFVSKPASGGKIQIKEVLKEGQDIVVQIDKEERGNKGAALTTFVSLAGRFIVLKPNKERSGGVSRRIVGEDRDLARQSLRDIDVPSGMSVILRTAGIDRSAEEFSWDLQNLLAVWETIKKVVVERPSPFLIYRESNAVIRALRDYMTNEIGEILIDDQKTYDEAAEFVGQVMPHNLRKLKHYVDPVPLFTRYQIESQIESAFSHTVTLPAGGSVVIDHTEAMVAIDINSARATKGSDIEATALNTNLEAADEVARQLRLRDLGGLVVIDFIDMGPQRNQREVENRLRDAVRQDRARVQIGKISRFGLLEMSRQRLRPSLGESSHLVCPRCSGIGNIRSVESLALSILRIIGEEARKERTAKVIAQLPVEVATYLLNEKRDWVQSLESSNETQVILVANPALETPHFVIRRVRDDQVELSENIGLSYTLSDVDEEPTSTQAMQQVKPVEIAAIETVVPQTPAPPRRTPQKSGPGFWSRLFSFFGSSSEDTQKKKSSGQRKSRSRSDSRRRGDQRSRRKSGDKRSADKRSSQRSNQSNAKRGKKTGNKDADRSAKSPRSGERTGQAKKSAQGSRDENQGEQRKPSSKRRSRGGRRRRRSSESTNAPAVEGNEQQNTEQGQAQVDAPAKESTQKDSRAPAAKDTKKESATPPESQDAKVASKPAAEDKKAEAPTEKVEKSAEPAKKKRGRRPAKTQDKKAETAAKVDTAAAPVLEKQSERPEKTSDFDVTQPALPVLKMTEDNAPPAKKPEPPVANDAPKREAKPAAKSEKPAAKSEKPAAKSEKPEAKVQAADSKPDSKPDAKPDAAKPEGRLLPWEDSAAPSSDSATKQEMSDQ
ncbi:MAG: ribonuclease E/G [Gammaproteobacteria bacterium]|nr:MAG: ribonuclease E/G [Gammaproteobacteria bacterium]